MNEHIVRGRSGTGRQDGELDLLEMRLRKLGTAGTCDACGQSVPPALRDELKGKAQARRAELARQREQAETAVELVFDRMRDNVYVVADSNHGYKMIAVGREVARELQGEHSTLLAPFRYERPEPPQKRLLRRGADSGPR